MIGNNPQISLITQMREFSKKKSAKISGKTKLQSLLLTDVTHMPYPDPPQIPQQTGIFGEGE
jgi:hypothetical protein